MIQAICWTLVHSLWQGLLFAMATGLVMLLTRRASAALRYNILGVLFFLFLAVCTGTFFYEWALTRHMVIRDADISNTAAGNVVATWISALGRYCSEHAVPIVWGWLFIFSTRSLHMLGSFLYTQRLRNYGIVAAPAGWQEKVDHFGRQLGITRAVKLVESRIVKMPLVIGHCRPMIFIPLGMLMGLPEGEMEAVLLHELAHIRRRDYIVNLLQSLAVNLFFFNPGLLWMSSLLREERENCCDDMAIARTHDRIELIRALINFKEHHLRLAGVAPAFPAGRNQLVKRVMRIAHNTNKTLDPVEKIFLSVSLILVSLLMAAAVGGSPAKPLTMAQAPIGKYRVFLEDRMVEGKNEKAVMPARAVTMEKEAALLKEEASADEKAALAAKAAAAEKVAIDEKQREDEKVRKFADDAHVSVTADAAQELRDKHRAELDAQQAIRDKEQARLDMEQAKRDAKQAFLDKMQAEKDMQQAKRTLHSVRDSTSHY